MTTETPTEKPCSKCGLVKPLEQFKAQAAGKFGRTARCRDCENNARRAKHAADPSKERQRNRARYAADPEKARARIRDQRAANPEATRAARRGWQAKRKATQVGATIGVVDDMAARLVGTDCYLCGKELPQDRADGSLIELDHVIPLAKGGAHCMDNLRPTHKDCNRRKNDRLLSELSWYSGPTDLGVAV